MRRMDRRSPPAVPRCLHAERNHAVMHARYLVLQARVRMLHCGLHVVLLRRMLRLHAARPTDRCIAA